MYPIKHNANVEIEMKILFSRTLGNIKDSAQYAKADAPMLIKYVFLKIKEMNNKSPEIQATPYSFESFLPVSIRQLSARKKPAK